jgi:DNA-binding MarR family transcriptional regulator
MPTGHEVAMALRIAYLTFHRQADALFAPRGVTADQFVLLYALSEGDAVTQQELVQRVCSDPNTVRAMLLLLERRGYVARLPHPTDGRARSVTLTPKGRRMLAKWRVKSEPLRERLMAAFGPDELNVLLDFLGRIARLPPANESGRVRVRQKTAARSRSRRRIESHE